MEIILRAAARVPDFQRLRPYQFLIAKGEGLDRLGKILQDAAIAAAKPPETVARALRMPHRAPLIIVVVAHPQPHQIVTLFEQQLTAGCAVHGHAMAALAQGFGGIWRSGWPMFDRKRA